jgi:methylmalonyl-CoA mutase N-terminal domain/subunit
MWARIMRERFGAREPASTMLRFHTQTAGVTLTAQQPYNNIVRVALQAFSAVCGGTQSLHTNGFDEALALPSEQAATLALRTQQVIAHESGAADSADPFAGSYLIESLTDEIERRATALIAKVDELGGSLEAIGYITNEIDESAWSYQERYRTGQDVVVGVNRYVEETETRIGGILQVDPAAERDQRARLQAFRTNRDGEAVRVRLDALATAARGSGNLVFPISAALRDRATVGEVCGTLREVFGTYRPA